MLDELLASDAWLAIPAIVGANVVSQLLGRRVPAGRAVREQVRASGTPPQAAGHR